MRFLSCAFAPYARLTPGSPRVPYSCHDTVGANSTEQRHEPLGAAHAGLFSPVAS